MGTERSKVMRRTTHSIIFQLHDERKIFMIMLMIVMVWTDYTVNLKENIISEIKLKSNENGKIIIGKKIWQKL